MDQKQNLQALLDSARQGDPFAQCQLGERYYRGLGVPQSFTEAAKWFRRSAEKGHAAAQHNLGVLYEKGQGVSKSYAQAVGWWLKAANQGQANSQFNLGNMYYAGRGVPHDYIRAKAWYAKAAAQGHGGAKIELEMMYDQMPGVPEDFAKALPRYLASAGRGDAHAQYDLGVFYGKGFGVREDYAESVRWYRKAAEQDHPKAQLALGVAYEFGTGVRQDFMEAYKWYVLSGAQGIQAAVYAREALLPRMSTQQFMVAHDRLTVPILQRYKREGRLKELGALNPSRPTAQQLDSLFKVMRKIREEETRGTDKIKCEDIIYEQKPGQPNRNVRILACAQNGYHYAGLVKKGNKFYWDGNCRSDSHGGGKKFQKDITQCRTKVYVIP